MLTGVLAEAGAVVGLFLFDSSFLGASAAPFDADDLATVKLSVFVGATLVRPVAALAPGFDVVAPFDCVVGPT